MNALTPEDVMITRCTIPDIVGFIVVTISVTPFGVMIFRFPNSDQWIIRGEAEDEIRAVVTLLPTSSLATKLTSLMNIGYHLTLSDNDLVWLKLRCLG